MKFIERPGPVARVKEPGWVMTPLMKHPHIVPETARRSIRDISAALDAFGAEYFLTDGSLLGAVRNQGFIPGDNDIDIRIERSAIGEPLVRHLSEAGFRCFRRVWVEGELSNLIFVHRKLQVDLTSFVRRAGELEFNIHFPIPKQRERGYLTYRIPDTGSEEAEILGIRTRLPKDPVAVLKALYGPDWHIPARKWDHFYNSRALVSATGNARLLERARRDWTRAQEVQ